MTFTVFRRGEIDGLHFYEIPSSVLKNRRVEETSDRIIILAPSDQYPSSTEMNNGGHSYQPIGSLHSFYPIDAKTAFPGQAVFIRRHVFNGEWIDSWVRQQISIPETLDVKIEEHQSRLSIVATTEKNGEIAKVRKIIQGVQPLREELAPILSHFEKNCRKPKVDAKFSCRIYLSRILEQLPENILKIVEGWLDRETEDSITISGAFLPQMSIDRLELRKATRSNRIAAHIWLAGRAELREDDTAVIFCPAEYLPTAILSGLKGIDLAEVTGLPWLANMPIRLAKIETLDKREHIRIRAVCGSVPLTMPAGRRIAEKEVAEIIRNPLSFFRGWSDVDISAREPLSGLSADEQLCILSMLSGRQDVDMAPFGKPGWVLGSRYDQIYAVKSPSTSFSEFFAPTFGAEAIAANEMLDRTAPS